MKIIDRFLPSLLFNPFNVDWLSSTQKTATWNNYLYNHSGNKEESVLLESFVFSDDTPKLTELQNIIDVMFKDKWDKLHDALTLEYGVIDNYNRIEDTTLTSSGTNNTSGNDNNTDVMTGGHSNMRTDNNTHKVSAFDDDTLVNNDSDTGTTDDVFEYDNETKTSTGTNTSNTTTSGSDITHSEIKGNIGVTTSQQMIQSEIELRRFNLITEMYNDLDTLLTIGVYVY